MLQALVMQGALAVILLTFALVSWGDTQAMLLFGVTLLIPVGWGLTFWRAFRRDEASRREGRWSRELDAHERRRVFGTLGALFVAWLVLAALVVLFV